MTESSVWERLGSPKFVVAPMVDASELAWRMLSRRHGAQLCFTPMLHSNIFVKHPRYRTANLVTCEEDRPLIVQFCGNDPDILLEAAKLAEPFCDAIDINLGCPQAIAKRGHYGAFLQDDWDLLYKIVSTLSRELTVPVTCKVRIFSSVEHSIAYAQMLESAGCKILTVHGRTKDQKGPLTGLASWEHIRAVRDNVKVPVIANGNIQCLADIERCLVATRCHAVMSAEGNLYNPALFEGISPPAYELALEYLDLVEKYPCPRSYVRGHLFKLFHDCFSLPENSDLRHEIAKAQNMKQFRATVLHLKERYHAIHEGLTPWNQQYTSYDLQLPPWLCKSFVRQTPQEHLEKIGKIVERIKVVNYEKENEENQTECLVRHKREHSVEPLLSKKKMKKLQKHQSVNPHCRRVVEKCSKCPNPVGLKCEFVLCKSCCRLKCYLENFDCAGHRILIRTRRERAKKRDAIKSKEKTNTEKSEIYSSQEHVDLQVACR
uniref:tRNA-dihydrouridine(16/17) synthase [NAD(P)(+)] n=1 Tax=Clastoptera arizonana TaxID=38151 RepID=A0A1B6DB79_9HEMI